MEEDLEYNIYNDLDDFDYEIKYKEKLEEIKTLEKQIQSLNNQIIEKDKTIHSLNKVNKNLEKNSSSLLKTAKLELSRKDNIIQTNENGPKTLEKRPNLLSKCTQTLKTGKFSVSTQTFEVPNLDNHSNPNNMSDKNYSRYMSGSNKFEESKRRNYYSDSDFNINNKKRKIDLLEHTSRSTNLRRRDYKKHETYRNDNKDLSKYDHSNNKKQHKNRDVDQPKEFLKQRLFQLSKTKPYSDNEKNSSEQINDKCEKQKENRKKSSKEFIDNERHINSIDKSKIDDRNDQSKAKKYIESHNKYENSDIEENKYEKNQSKKKEESNQMVKNRENESDEINKLKKIDEMCLDKIPMISTEVLKEQEIKQTIQSTAQLDLLPPENVKEVEVEKSTNQVALIAKCNTKPENTTTTVITNLSENEQIKLTINTESKLNLLLGSTDKSIRTPESVPIILNKNKYRIAKKEEEILDSNINKTNKIVNDIVKLYKNPFNNNSEKYLGKDNNQLETTSLSNNDEKNDRKEIYQNKKILEQKYDVSKSENVELNVNQNQTETKEDDLSKLLLTQQLINRELLEINKQSNSSFNNDDTIMELEKKDDVVKLNIQNEKISLSHKQQDDHKKSKDYISKEIISSSTEEEKLLISDFFLLFKNVPTNFNSQVSNENNCKIKVDDNKNLIEIQNSDAIINSTSNATPSKQAIKTNLKKKTVSESTQSEQTLKINPKIEPAILPIINDDQNQNDSHNTSTSQEIIDYVTSLKEKLNKNCNDAMKKLKNKSTKSSQKDIINNNDNHNNNSLINISKDLYLSNDDESSIESNDCKLFLINDFVEKETTKIDVNKEIQKNIELEKKQTEEECLDKKEQVLNNNKDSKKTDKLNDNCAEKNQGKTADNLIISGYKNNTLNLKSSTVHSEINQNEKGKLPELKVKIETKIQISKDNIDDINHKRHDKCDELSKKIIDKNEEQPKVNLDTKKDIKPIEKFQDKKQRNSEKRNEKKQNQPEVITDKKDKVLVNNRDSLDKNENKKQQNKDNVDKTNLITCPTEIQIEKPNMNEEKVQDKNDKHRQSKNRISQPDNKNFKDKNTEINQKKNEKQSSNMKNNRNDKSLKICVVKNKNEEYHIKKDKHQEKKDNCREKCHSELNKQKPEIKRYKSDEKRYDVKDKQHHEKIHSEIKRYDEKDKQHHEKRHSEKISHDKNQHKYPTNNQDYKKNIQDQDKQHSSSYHDKKEKDTKSQRTSNEYEMYTNERKDINYKISNGLSHISDNNTQLNLDHRKHSKYYKYLNHKLNQVKIIDNNDKKHVEQHESNKNEQLKKAQDKNSEICQNENNALNSYTNFRDCIRKKIDDIKSTIDVNNIIKRCSDSKLNEISEIIVKKDDQEKTIDVNNIENEISEFIVIKNDQQKSIDVNNIEKCSDSKNNKRKYETNDFSESTVKEDDQQTAMKNIKLDASTASHDDSVNEGNDSTDTSSLVKKSIEYKLSKTTYTVEIIGNETNVFIKRPKKSKKCKKEKKV